MFFLVMFIDNIKSQDVWESIMLYISAWCIKSWKPIETAPYLVSLAWLVWHVQRLTPGHPFSNGIPVQQCKNLGKNSIISYAYIVEIMDINKLFSWSIRAHRRYWHLHVCIYVDSRGILLGSYPRTLRAMPMQQCLSWKIFYSCSPDTGSLRFCACSLTLAAAPDIHTTTLLRMS